MQLRPALALARGQWCKLICGASFHHLPTIHNLALIYTLAGVDCIDLAADPAIVQAAQAGIAQAQALQPNLHPPWLMASLNAGEDPHFRKAVIAGSCPPDCPQPCLQVWPPQAQAPTPPIQISEALCYGCGRCQPVCPYQSLTMNYFAVSAGEVLPRLLHLGIQAVEIHTQVGELPAFRQIWQVLQPWVAKLALVSISCGDGPELGSYLRSLLEVMQPRPALLIWQTDGRPMSGDLGVGATRATLNLARKVLDLHLPGYVQLAGGTNIATMPKARQLGIPVAGVAYGSYARHLVAAAAEHQDLTRYPDLLWASVAQARTLLNTVKTLPESGSQDLYLSRGSPPTW
ncbi:MAG: LdpA C-terminal domain-containing domain [Thermostichales cyanobacterium BF3_bins_165]